MLWTLIGVTGGIFGIQNLKDSKKNIDALLALNGKNIEKYRPLRMLAYGHYRNDLFRLSKLFTITTVGVIAMLAPPVTKNAQPISPVGVAITVGFFLIAIQVLLASILDRRQREAMENL